MKTNYYGINLDRSPDRWQALSRDAAATGLDLIRVPAVDGKTVPADRRTMLDEAGFRSLHGKIPMDGEYGCYASHIAALELFLASDAQAAVIFEDDAQPLEGFAEGIAAVLAADDWDMVKLMHHRLFAFVPIRDLGAGRRLGRAAFGPTGSSAAYVVNRPGAARLVAGLLPMRLPYDVALERGWALGLRVRHVRPDLVRANPDTRKTLVGGRSRYARQQLPAYRRLSTLVFRASDLVRRLYYAYA